VLAVVYNKTDKEKMFDTSDSAFFTLLIRISGVAATLALMVDISAALYSSKGSMAGGATSSISKGISTWGASCGMSWSHMAEGSSYFLLIFKNDERDELLSHNYVIFMNLAVSTVRSVGERMVPEIESSPM
jgi:hypothetical protein